MSNLVLEVFGYGGAKFLAILVYIKRQRMQTWEGDLIWLGCLLTGSRDGLFNCLQVALPS